MAKGKKEAGDTQITQPFQKKKVKGKRQKRDWNAIKQEYLLTPPDPNGIWVSNEAWCKERGLPWPGSDKHMRGWRNERDDKWAEYARKAMEKSAARIIESEGRMKARFYNMASRILRIAEKNLESLEAMVGKVGSNQMVDRAATADLIKQLRQVQAIMHKAMGLDDIKFGVNLTADGIVALIRKLPEAELNKLLDQFEQMGEDELDA